MNDIASIDATADRRARTPSATAGRDEGGVSSDFETFLKMLTVQMENQDPLNPVDSADYAVQLATFSGVEQQVLTNDLLASLVDRMGGGLAELAGWVGREVRVEAPIAFDGAPVTVAPKPDAEATEAMLIVRNAVGDVLDRQQIPTDGRSIDWVPRSAAEAPERGTSLTFEVESYAGETRLRTIAAEVYSPVREIRRGTGGLEVVIAGGATVAAKEVTALREG